MTFRCCLTCACEERIIEKETAVLNPKAVNSLLTKTCVKYTVGYKKEPTYFCL